MVVQKVHIVYPSLLGNEEGAAMLEVQLMHDADLTHQLVFASPSACSQVYEHIENCINNNH